MPSAKSVHASQVFSQAHCRVNFIGRVKLPFIAPARTSRSNPRGTELTAGASCAGRECDGLRAREYNAESPGCGKNEGRTPRPEVAPRVAGALSLVPGRQHKP